MAEKGEELVHVEELVWEEEDGPGGEKIRKRVARIGNSYELSRADATEGVKAGNYRIAGLAVGALPEGFDKNEGGKRKGGGSVAADG